MRIGIFFGGPSREREISFAGGKTAFEYLDKSLFEPVPVFVDSFGSFILLEKELMYSTEIREFYPRRKVLSSRASKHTSNPFPNSPISRCPPRYRQLIAPSEFKHISTSHFWPCTALIVRMVRFRVCLNGTKFLIAARV
jgi:D-alanine-D-alanine ligase